jgi:quaternary ammonium compound-resistance protein SugE
MAWTYLVIAGLLEVAWAIGLKYTQGWTKLYPSLLTAAAMVASFYFLSLAVKTLPIGTSYAVWTGIGTVGAALFGILVLGESRDVSKIVCILLIVSDIIGLKLTSSN